MKGLLVQDLYTNRWSFIFILGMMVIFSITIPSALYFMAILWAAMIPFSAMSQDEISKWNVTMKQMPYRDRDVVLEKYVLGYLMLVSVNLLLILVGPVLHLDQLIQHSESDLQIVDPVLVAISTLFFISIILPPLFRFGVRKGKMISVLLCGLGGAVIGIGINSPELESLYPIFLAVVILLNFISFLLSLRFYRRSLR